MKLQHGEPVAVAVRGSTTQAGTFLRDLDAGHVEVWIGSRPRRVRRDHVSPTTRPAAPVKTYERLFGDDD